MGDMHDERVAVIAALRAMPDPEAFCRRWVTGNRDPWQQIALENPALMWLTWERMTGITRREITDRG